MILKGKPVKQTVTVRVIYFLTYAAGSSWLTYFNLFLKNYIGLSDSEVGIISAVQQVNILLLLPFWGMIADRFGRKNILLLNMFFVIVFLYGFLLQKTFISILAFTYFFTLFYNPLTPLFDSIVLDYIEQNKNLSYGMLRLWASIGWALSAAVTGYFISAENVYIIFPVASAILVVNWLILKFIYRPLIVVKNLQSLKMRHLKDIVFKDKRLYIMLIIMLFYGIFSAPIHLFINVYYAEIGAKYYEIGYAYFFQAMAEVPFFFYSKRIIDKIGARRVIVLTMFVTSLRLFAYGMNSSPWMAIIIGLSHGICLALFLVAFISFVHQFIPPEWRSTGQSFVYAVYFGGGMALGNVWVGFTAGKIGMRGAMLVESSLTLVLVIVTLLVFGILKKINDRYWKKVNKIYGS